MFWTVLMHNLVPMWPIYFAIMLNYESSLKKPYSAVVHLWSLWWTMLLHCSRTTEKYWEKSSLEFSYRVCNSVYSIPPAYYIKLPADWKIWFNISAINFHEHLCNIFTSRIYVLRIGFKAKQNRKCQNGAFHAECWSCDDSFEVLLNNKTLPFCKNVYTFFSTVILYLYIIR